MYSIKRRKRDTAENIYRHCKATGTCPPDVENKVEGNTLADRLLRIFSSIIYLGGLGIGTGKGTGGTLGYRPLEPVTPRTPVRVSPRPSRPSTFGVPIDPIGTSDIVTLSGPSIVPLNEGGLPDPTVISTGIGPGEGLGEVEILTNLDATQDISTVGGHPTIIPGSEDNIAVLDVTPLDPPPVRIAYENPESTDLTLITSTLPSETNYNVFVDPNYNGVQIGEEIELQPINTIEQFSIEENIPKTSTPVRILETAAGRAKKFYNRLTQQVSTRNIDFLGQASRLVQFEFENPAFQPDVSLEFEKDVQSLAAAPEPDFADIIKLSRPSFSETEEGLIRVSRLGTKASMVTRSGAVLTQPVHYFYDISAIPEETIELQPIGELSGDNTIVDELLTGIEVRNPDIFETSFTEADLLESQIETFNNAHLIVDIEEDNELLQVPTLPPGVSVKVFIDDYAKDLVVNYSQSIDNSSINTSIIVNPEIRPTVIIDPLSTDYYLHPSLLRRKRKRSEMF
uniref:Minor capsid protein L2 n=1 Tax=Human papillomavirus TaxID=10566 RepID=A0A385PKZ8_9PAPI|nr:MAG: L2 protein [Human papillomavirus]